MTALLQDAAKECDPLLEFLDVMLGNSSAKGHIMPNSQTAEIYSSDGEMIAGYNGLGGGWTSVQTKAESKFLSEAASVYAQAFKQAREGFRADAAAAHPGSSSVDIRA